MGPIQVVPQLLSNIWICRDLACSSTCSIIQEMKERISIFFAKDNPNVALVAISQLLNTIIRYAT